MRRFLCLGLIFSIVLWGGSAWALSMADTMSYIDWGSLSIDILEGGTSASENPAYEWRGNQFTHVRAEAQDDNGAEIGVADRYFDTWGDYSQTASVDNAEGLAETTYSDLYVSAFAIANGYDTESASAAADLHRSGSIYAFEDLTLSISIDYYIDHHLITDAFDEDADIYSLVDFSLSHMTYDSNGVGTQDYYVSDWTEDAGSGTLTFTADLISGLEYGLNTHLYSSVNVFSPEVAAAPVPEPSTMVLMGLGLVGLAGIGRKRLKT